MVAASLNLSSPLATRPRTSTLSSSLLLMAVLFNETSSSGWRSQFKGTFLTSPRGDIIREFQHAEAGLIRPNGKTRQECFLLSATEMSPHPTPELGEAPNRVPGPARGPGPRFARRPRNSRHSLKLIWIPA